MRLQIFTPKKYLLETLAGWLIDLSAAWFIIAAAAFHEPSVLTVNLVYSTVCLILAMGLNRKKENYV